MGVTRNLSMRPKVAYGMEMGRLRDIVKLVCHYRGVSSPILVKSVFLGDIRYFRKFHRQLTGLSYVAGCGEVICLSLIHI